MVEFPDFPGLEGLLGLARRDRVDIRATLLRVLTDIYVQVPTHSPQEERQYTEQALRLIGSADVPTRLAVAKRLAPYARAPHVIIDRLARDVVEVAEPLLKHSPCLTPSDLDAIAQSCGATHAAVIARRGETTASQEAAGAVAGELCELFYATDGNERRLILINLDYSNAPVLELAAPMQQADIWRLENAALSHHSAAVSRELERALGVSQGQARRMINDEQGEPIVVAAKAMNLPADVVQRLLLFINPVIGQSVDRVYQLATLYGEITVDAARRMAAILRDADLASHKATQPDRSSRQPGAYTARRRLFDITEPLVPRRDPSSAQHPGRDAEPATSPHRKGQATT
jgi:hypothetical protein